MNAWCPASRRLVPGAGHGKRVHCPQCGRRVVAIEDRLKAHRLRVRVPQ